jgi:5-methylcytosine-specific restriction endonuclease McrA
MTRNRSGYDKAYRACHKDQISEYLRQYRASHRAEIAEQKRRNRTEHKEERVEYDRRYRAAHPEVGFNHHARRRALVGETKISKHDWITVMRHWKWCCAYCGQHLTETTQTVDHIVPLSQGGPHSRWNLAPACRSCNSSKKERMPHQWSANPNPFSRRLWALTLANLLFSEQEPLLVF